MSRFTLTPPVTGTGSDPQTRQIEQPQPMARAFPLPGPQLRYVYEELDEAAGAVRALAPRRNLLYRPWDPPSCTDPVLRQELWLWLDAVVVWLNTEYTWNADAMIPSCWPHHPHLVHEIAVLADQRHAAGLTYTSNALEEWHRYALPAFSNRMTDRIRSHCVETHDDWPGTARHTRGTAHAPDRLQRFAQDIASLAGEHVDHHTGEILDPTTSAEQALERLRRGQPGG
jgi:hypothetical protein